jgi:isopenicillin-N N-acyltransferase-like protein
MSKKTTLPLVEVSGKPFDMGREIGKKCALRVTAYRKAIAASIAHYTGRDWRTASARALLHLPYAEEFYPDYVEELKGYAEGAKISFEDAFTMCCHELLTWRGFKGCTDIVANDHVTSDGNVLAAHNEDWSSDCLDVVVFLHAKPKGKPEFFTTSYAGLVPSCGMNSAGISLTGNALEPNDVRLGIPKVFPVRKVMEARRIGEALEYAMPPARASSYNNIVCDKNGEMYSLEGSATDCAWLYALDGYLVHTNHYTAERMLRFESDPLTRSCSIFRYNRALRLVEDQLGSVDVDSLKAILRDHVNRPGSICRHADPGVHPLDVSETIFSVIYDVTNLEAHVLKGKPCAGEYIKFSLDG